MAEHILASQNGVWMKGLFRYIDKHSVKFVNCNITRAFVFDFIVLISGNSNPPHDSGTHFCMSRWHIMSLQTLERMMLSNLFKKKPQSLSNCLAGTLYSCIQSRADGRGVCYNLLKSATGRTLPWFMSLHLILFFF